MSKTQGNILVFGGGALQKSIICECRRQNLFTVVIDPNPNAESRYFADVFEVVESNNFFETCSVVEKYKIKGIIYSSTDKPSLMMSHIAVKYKFPFISIKTARYSTDKKKMKTLFIKHNIPCAKGKLIKKATEITSFPVIIKPRDGSGSRGVFYCKSKTECALLLKECFQQTRLSTVLSEEFIEGKEYSIEALHYNGKTKVIQFTEKNTSPYPYNVEMGHIAPAKLTERQKKAISKIIKKISDVFKFEYCASHTELKLNNEKITIIETSPRLGGDLITSHLVPFSTGINMEGALVKIAMNAPPPVLKRKRSVAGIFYFNFPPGKINNISDLSRVFSIKGIVNFEFKLRRGNTIPKIKNSIDRYGYFMIKVKNFKELFNIKKRAIKFFNRNIDIKPEN